MAAPSKLLVLSLSLALPLSVLAYFWWRKRNRVVPYESVGHVSGLFIYPVKSCRGISLDSATCLTEGLRFDRRWIVMDKNEKIVSIGEKPSLGLVVPHFEDDKYLCLNAPGMDTLKLDLESQADSKDIVDLRVLRISSKSQYAGDEAAEWFSMYLNCPGCKVYRVYEPRLSTDDTKWGDKALQGDKTGFAYFSAYLMTTESSLVVLNEKLPSPVGMDRFRANIVIGGTDPFAEDQWKGKAMKIGDVKFRFLKECGRCIVTTVDPGTGKRTGYEPLSTLRKMRLFKDMDPRHGNAPFFGSQMAPDNEGIVKLGDPVSVAC